MSKGKIDFDRSEAQKQPCPKYLLSYPSKKTCIRGTVRKSAKKNAQFINIKKDKLTINKWPEFLPVIFIYKLDGVEVIVKKYYFSMFFLWFCI